MKEFFTATKFRDASLELINTINDVLDEYSQQGYDLSLRQLYYQLVARGYIENSQKSYSKIGDLVSDGRLAGLIDWDMIVDRGRVAIANTHWTSPADIVDAAASQYKIDKWEDQPNHIEVMVEKQALEGVLIPVCRRLDVTFRANKGYTSQSMMYRLGKDLSEIQASGKDIHVLYFGDHDPSGLDMDRDVQERIALFSGRSVAFERLALKYAQVQVLNPPENPAKVTDSRAKQYIKMYGASSWELDAIEPKELARLVEAAVVNLRDDALWQDALDKENEMKDELKGFAKEYRRKTE
jgi:hypothetical protein